MFDLDTRIRGRYSKATHVYIVGFVAMLMILALPASAKNGPKYKVTVTNLTRGSDFAPILVASHAPGLKLFVPGMPASAELETMAETGDPASLQTAIAPYTFDSEVLGGLAPGATAMTIVEARGRYDHVSVAAMLVPTNDAFFAVNGIKGPFGRQTIMVVSPAYDAGTEENDENCTSATNGGPCGTGPSVGEGYVHVHGGIHGVGDLIAADYDWRNPVARIVIERVP